MDSTHFWQRLPGSGQTLEGGGTTITVTLHMGHAVTFLVTPMLALSDCSTAVYESMRANPEPVS